MSSSGRALLIGTIVFVAGIAVDQAWHATHSEFETASDQLRAHAILWAGTLVMLWASARALRARSRAAGYRVVLVAAGAYAIVHVWHFWEHSEHRDPAVPHVLLVLGVVVMLSGALWVAVASRSRAH